MTVISEGLGIDGTVSGVGSLTVEGQVRGSVDIDGDVTVVSGAQIEASVDAVDVAVSGEVRGPITATRSVTIEAGADVQGTVSAPRISIDPQARVVGAVKMELDLPRGTGSRR